MENEKEVAVKTEGTLKLYLSWFWGGLLVNYFIRYLCNIVSFYSLGFARPAMVRWLWRWETDETYYHGRSLVFTGSAREFTKKCLLWTFLSIITLGVFYVFYACIAVERWRVEHTHFEDPQQETDSRFEGRAISWFGVKLAATVVSCVTLGFGIGWAHCYLERMRAKRTVIDGRRLYFSGRAGQYTVKWLAWVALCLVTCGVYAIWAVAKSKRWTVLHTETEEDDPRIAAAYRYLASKEYERKERARRRYLKEKYAPLRHKFGRETFYKVCEELEEKDERTVETVEKASYKNIVGTTLLSVFLGSFAAGRFYLGDLKLAVLKICISVASLFIGAILLLLDSAPTFACIAWAVLVFMLPVFIWSFVDIFLSYIETKKANLGTYKASCEKAAA